MLDYQTLIDTALAGILALVGWWNKTMYNTIQDQQKELSTFKQDVPQKYVSKEDHKDDLREIKDMFKHIMDKLDQKADK